MCNQIYMFDKIVSSESGAKPMIKLTMIKLTSVFHDNQSVQTITENMTIHSICK